MRVAVRWLDVLLKTLVEKLTFLNVEKIKRCLNRICAHMISV